MKNIYFFSIRAIDRILKPLVRCILRVPQCRGYPLPFMFIVTNRRQLIHERRGVVCSRIKARLAHALFSTSSLVSHSLFRTRFLAHSSLSLSLSPWKPFFIFSCSGADHSVCIRSTSRFRSSSLSASFSRRCCASSGAGVRWFVLTSQ